MAREIFVDSGAWVGLSTPRDQYHARATATYPAVRRRWRDLVTTNLVVAESYISIRRQAGLTAAMEFLTQLRSLPNLVLIYSDADWEDTATAILRRYADHDFSYTDAVSFAVMRGRGIADAFTFDRHFLAAGFTSVPVGSS